MTFEIGTDGIGGLVVGFDGSDPSRDALAFSAGIARRNNASLTVVYAVDTAADGLAALAPGAAGLLGATEVDAAGQIHVEVRNALAGVAVEWDFVTVRGDPAAALERIAAERQLDAIVVGRSRSRLRRRLGSIPARLMRTADRPITVVP